MYKEIVFQQQSKFCGASTLAMKPKRYLTAAFKLQAKVDLDDAGWCEGRRTAYLEAGSGAGEARVVGFGVPKLGMVGSATSEFRVSGSGAPESMVARTGHRKGEGRRRLVVDRR
uniref:Uncharacterized protein n=1 Tax=Oryza rufipogon TaxID=4529 RepID=A0A0E0RAP7_ORYRU